VHLLPTALCGKFWAAQAAPFQDFIHSCDCTSAFDMPHLVRIILCLKIHFSVTTLAPRGHEIQSHVPLDLRAEYSFS
jgi:hypothetical protein